MELVDIRSLARSHCRKGIETLAGFAHQEAIPPHVRVAAIQILLDRGYGKAAQPITGENGEGDIRVTIRNIIEERQTITIDAEPVKTVTKMAGNLTDEKADG